MPSYKDSIQLPHHISPLAGPFHHLEEEDAVIADRFSPSAKHIGGTHRRNPNRISDAFACDDFRMYDHKVRRCMRGRSHDWTDCPFAHPGEKARRRDPRKIHYSGEPCPDFRKGSCWRGDACKYAHGVFECWLHPSRYRTQPCKDGKDCTRKVCFFAHSMRQLRHMAAAVEESLAEGAPMDSHTHEQYSHTHELGSPVGMGLLEDSFKDRKYMVDSYEHEVGLALPTNSLALSSGDMYANVSSISETLSMLTLSSQNLSGSPSEAISTMGFSSNNAMGVPLQVHPPFSNFSTVCPGPPSSGMGAILSHMNGSPLQQAAARQTFLIREGYGKGGESIFTASADEGSDMVHYRGYGDRAMLHGFMNASGRGRPDVNEVANELRGSSKSMGLSDQLALMWKEMYEFSSYNPCGSYGLSSPTSTLAGPLYLSPFSSPPLSPLSTPSSETSIFSLRGHGTVQADDRSPKPDAHIQNRYCVKELESKHIFTGQQSLHSNHHSRLVGYEALSQCLELPTFPQCMSGQNKWIPLCNNWNSEGNYKHGISQVTSDDMLQKICDRVGEGGPVETATPDLGWVHELVM